MKYRIKRMQLKNEVKYILQSSIIGLLWVDVRSTGWVELGSVYEQTQKDLIEENYENMLTPIITTIVKRSWKK